MPKNGIGAIGDIGPGIGIGAVPMGGTSCGPAMPNGNKGAGPGSRTFGKGTRGGGGGIGAGPGTGGGDEGAGGGWHKVVPGISDSFAAVFALRVPGVAGDASFDDLGIDFFGRAALGGVFGCCDDNSVAAGAIVTLLKDFN